MSGECDVRIDVSVIVPTFRRERLVVEAVESALAQRGVSVEVIVMDDSPDGSAEAAVGSIAKGSERVRYAKRVSPSGGRPAVVRNEGARAARGLYLHFLDDDDRLEDGALRALRFALDSSRAGAAFGVVTPFGDDAAVLARQATYFQRAAEVARQLRGRRRFAAQMLFADTLLVNSAGMIRKSAFEALGGYDVTLPIFEDVEFYMRAGRRFGIDFVDRPILQYRTGAPSLMHDLRGNEKTMTSYARIYDRYRRENGALEFLALKLFAKVALAPIASEVPFCVES